SGSSTQFPLEVLAPPRSVSAESSQSVSSALWTVAGPNALSGASLGTLAPSVWSKTYSATRPSAWSTSAWAGTELITVNPRARAPNVAAALVVRAVRIIVTPSSSMRIVHDADRVSGNYARSGGSRQGRDHARHPRDRITPGRRRRSMERGRPSRREARLPAAGPPSSVPEISLRTGPSGAAAAHCQAGGTCGDQHSAEDGKDLEVRTRRRQVSAEIGRA